MLQTFSCAGNWFIPGSSQQFNGTIYYDPVDGARLDIFGSFDNVEWDPRTHPVVLGDTAKGKFTLLNCHFRTSRRTNHDLVESSYTPVLILQGEHFPALEDIQFTDVYFELFNLFEWCNIRSLRSEHDPTDHANITVTYGRPADIAFTLHEHCQGNIRFGSLSAHKSHPHQITTTETCTVHLKFDARKSFDDILTDVTIFYQFISLCTFEQSYPLTVLFTDPAITARFQHEAIDKTWKKHIRCHFSNTYYKPEFKVRGTDEHILRYPDIADRFSEIINAWYRHYKQIEPTFILLLRFFQEKFTANTEKFMDQARAIEVFHRRTEDINRMSPEEYQDFVVRAIRNPALTDEEIEWLESKLSFGYEPSLRKRLKHLLKKYSNPITKAYIPDTEKFITDVVENRNAYTHFGKKEDWEPLKGLELQEVADKIMLLLIVGIFTLLGIPSEKYTVGLNRQFLRRIRLSDKLIRR